MISHYSFADKNECNFCGIDCRLKTELILHKLSVHKIGCKEAKISQILDAYQAEDVVYSSESECDYRISYQIERIPKKEKILHEVLLPQIRNEPKEEEIVENFNAVFLESTLKSEMEDETFDDFENGSMKGELSRDESDHSGGNALRTAEARVRKKYMKRDTKTLPDLAKTAACCLCFKEFSKRSVLRLHLSTIHQLPLPEVQKMVPKKGRIQLTESALVDESVRMQIRENANMMAKCVFCYKSYASREYLRRHLMGKHGLSTDDAWTVAPRKGKSEPVNYEPDVSFECYVCKSVFTEVRQLQAHFRAEHREPVNYCRKKNKTGKAGKYQCPVCKHFYAKNSTRKFHMQTIHKMERNKVDELTRTRRAVDIKQLLDSDDSLLLELKPKSEDAKPALQLECYICKKSYAKLYTLRVHMDQLHRAANETSKYYTGKRHKEDEFGLPITKFKSCPKEKKVQHCNHCDRDFTKSILFEAHMNFLKGGKRFFCRVCCTGFDELVLMKQHKRLSEKCKSVPQAKSYLCYHCGKGFTKKCALDFHIRSHTNEKPFHCEYCEARFKYKNALEIHTAKHTNILPYKCTFDNCDEAFPNHGALAQHKRKHIETSPEYVCNVCGVVFEKKSDLG